MRKLLLQSIILLGVMSCQEDKTILDNSGCYECQHPIQVTVSKTVPIVGTSPLKEEVMKATAKFNFGESIDFSKAEIVSFNETNLSSALWIPISESAAEKTALYFITYANHIQIGYLMKWKITPDGKTTVSQYNMDDKLFVEYSAFKDKPVRMDLLEAKNVISSRELRSSSSKGAKLSCTFPTNFAHCAQNYLVQLTSNPLAGLGCLYFGPECATVIAGTCTIDAGIATSQGNCINLVNPS